ncbi:GIY-YIG nuclease family protein [Neotabrizicola sp. sgz301269]|uniref:GIY-YIG nuclease family protein n=1 Tax=Neotabrizicola sp. sgz301269 TaxID=3276282 RepID=UPI00376FFADA
MHHLEGPSSTEDLTLSLSSISAGLLSPDRLWRPCVLHRHIAERSITHGVYAWWFDGCLPRVPRDGCSEREGKCLLYIGIAPPRINLTPRRSSSPMLRRLRRNHLHGTVRTSTLRLSLAALLHGELGFDLYRDEGGRVRMGRTHEELLTTWIDEHAAVSAIHHDNPWSIERALITCGPPLPLNLSMSRHSFSTTLSALRRSLGRPAYGP